MGFGGGHHGHARQRTIRYDELDPEQSVYGPIDGKPAGVAVAVCLAAIAEREPGGEFPFHQFPDHHQWRDIHEQQCEWLVALFLSAAELYAGTVMRLSSSADDRRQSEVRRHG